MMQAAAIVLDLDGTLLNSNKEVSPRNLRAVRQCRERNIPVIIATARPPRAIMQLLPAELLDLGIMIYYNGALVVSERLEMHEHFPLDPLLLGELIAYLESCECMPQISVEASDKWYSNKELDYSALIKVHERPALLSLEELASLAASKLLVTNFSAVDELVNQYGKRANILHTDAGQLVQIMSIQATKEQALMMVCSRLNITAEQIIVFGDDYNDLGLFRICGYPIAMGNAIRELQEIAYKVTDTNDNDGVALVLEQLLLEAEVS
ncbi:HAD family hydrolase [Paenibacillus lignilyticus]|uniref:HAD family hydrolase n=1 Tax=Paenibacillus lignilyticus TaxID=1172615 RepID=A0ABS5CD47_9BACL|nr:HAD family hydrolase [Paenibacillus lignilyticus]MBP3963876.1 HAD family hydrolase [Paenibacillus lignilyticus]